LSSKSEKRTTSAAVDPAPLDFAFGFEISVNKPQH
jgi:hypothetical protein